MSIIIRKWERQDYRGIAELFLQVHQFHAENRPDIYAQTDKPFSEEDFSKLLCDDHSVTLVADKDGAVVGFVLATLRKPSENPLLLPRKVAYLEDLAVHEDFRGQGIGRSLFHAAQDAARAQGYNTLELMVWEFNSPARELYEKLGMKTRSIILETKL